MTTSAPDRPRLHRAASLLGGVGWADPTNVDPEIALLCLAAFEQLRPWTELAAPAAITVGVPLALDDALASLASLSDEVFAEEAVLEAADYARRARALLA